MCGLWVLKVRDNPEYTFVLQLLAALLLSALALTLGVDFGSEGAGKKILADVLFFYRSVTQGQTYSSHFRANQ